MPHHDGLYHQMFDHPEMVAEPLREFVPGPWLDDLDLDGMTRENAKYHAATGDRREGDMVWRIPRLVCIFRLVEKSGVVREDIQRDGAFD